MTKTIEQQLIRIAAGSVELEGVLELPDKARGIVLFAHGSGSSRHSVRNNYVAGEIRRNLIATLLLDLLTPQEESTAQARFDIELLTQRLLFAIDWLRHNERTRELIVGLFGASTGAAAALQAAAMRGDEIAAVVARGGRPDLAGHTALERVRAPTLLIVGGLDDVVIELNRSALSALRCVKRIEIIPGATHLFEEPGTLEAVAALASEWFAEHLENADRRFMPAASS